MVADIAATEPSQFDSFRPFTWVERNDVRRAQELAAEDHSATVTEIHLLLSILEGTSNTRDWLAQVLGPNFDRLRHIAEQKRRKPPSPLKTPLARNFDDQRKRGFKLLDEG